MRYIMKKIYFLILLVSMAVFLTAGTCTTPEVDPQTEDDTTKTADTEAEIKEAADKKADEAKKAAAEKKKELKKDAAEKKLAAEKEAAEAKIAAATKKAADKEATEIAEEQDADKSVEAPKPDTIILAPPEETNTAFNEMELVYFDYDKSTISPAFTEIIQKNYEWIAENPDVQIQLEGHCDERGTNEYNLALGERRAKAVFDLLLSLGANPSQFTLVSFGEERPAVSGSNEFSWGKNRRVEFTRL